MLTQAEMARRLNISVATMKVWGHHGLLPRHIHNDKHEWLYEPLGEHPPVKMPRWTAENRQFLDRQNRQFLSSRDW